MEMVSAVERRIRNGLRQLRHTIELGIWLTIGVLVGVAIAVGIVFFVFLFSISLVLPFVSIICLIAVGLFLYAFSCYMLQVYIEILKRRYLLNINQDDDEDNTCVVCLDRERNAAILPCGHDRFCYACALRCLNDEAYAPKCPICRGPIVYVYRDGEGYLSFLNF